MVRFWQEKTGQADYFSAQDKAIIAIKKAFDANGVTIPFPIRTLDFGITGGVRLDEMYPMKELKNNYSSKNGDSAKH